MSPTNNDTGDRFDRFIFALWRELKRWMEPTFSMVELVGLLAILAFESPWWINLPLILVWLVWRNRAVG